MTSRTLHVAMQGERNGVAARLREAIVVQQKGGDLSQRRLPHAHGGLKARVAQSPPHEALRTPEDQFTSVPRYRLGRLIALWCAATHTEDDCHDLC